MHKFTSHLKKKKPPFNNGYNQNHLVKLCLITNHLRISFAISVTLLKFLMI